LESQCEEGHLKKLALSTTEWRSLAPFFGFDESEIEEIIHEHSHSIQQQNIEFYIRWRVKARNATYRRLIEILHDVKRNDLVTKVVELLHSHNHDDNDTYTLEDLVKDVSKEMLDSTCREGDLKILALATTKWKTISPFLGFKKFEEEKIVSDYQDNITRQKIELYLQWREKDVKNATNRKLIEKLYIIKRIDLVKELVKLLTQSNNYDIFEDDDGYTIYLRKIYRMGVLPQAPRWPPVERCKYVTLSLIQEEEVHERNYEDEFDGLMIQYSPVKKNSLQVTLDNILKLDQSHRKVILVEGTSGVGKTTLALHICHRWAEGLLFESYKYVILIQLQNSKVQTAQTLADILPHPSTKEPTKLCQFPVEKELSSL
jgi:DNA replication protein DnaC